MQICFFIAVATSGRPPPYFKKNTCIIPTPVRPGLQWAPGLYQYVDESLADMLEMGQSLYFSIV